MSNLKMGGKIRALVKLRCGKKIEKANKYWLDESFRNCIFRGNALNCMEHYVEEYSRTIKRLV